MFYEVTLWLAAGIGLAAALAGNRTAWPLLASFAVATALCWNGEFVPALWIGIDLAVIMAILLLGNGWRDALILALFPVAWLFYFSSEWSGFVAWAVVITQFLLAARPVLPRIYARWKANLDHRDEWTNLDPREASV